MTTEATRSLFSARAFNLGSDARLNGQVAAINPHTPGSLAGIYWRMGWEQCDKEWGRLVRGRWLIHPLPPILVKGLLS